MRIILLLVILAFCFFESSLHQHSALFRECEAALPLLHGTILAVLIVWCATLLLFDHQIQDWPLIGLISLTITYYCFAASPAPEALSLVFGVTLEKWRASL